MDRCSLCKRKSKADLRYCKYHLEAFNNLNKAYEAWSRAMGIVWKDYLTEVSKTKGIGELAREVAQHILDDEMEDKDAMLT